MSGEIILIIDDNLINLKLLKVLLKLEGYEVHTATDANEALDLLTTINPHVILMDLQLPVMDGLELTQLLKRNPKYKNTIIIAITAYAMKGDKERALAAGCDDYMSKPIDIDAISKMIAAYIHRKKDTVGISSRSGRIGDAYQSIKNPGGSSDGERDINY